jgi:hypothetical protein
MGGHSSTGKFVAILQSNEAVNHLPCDVAVVPQPELRDQLGCSKLSKLREIDGVYQLRGAVGGANPPLRLVLGGGGETPPAMWGERL